MLPEKILLSRHKIIFFFKSNNSLEDGLKIENIKNHFNFFIQIVLVMLYTQLFVPCIILMMLLKAQY